ncbi:unnamed protein product [Adineta ricciae]|uniref:G-protein coupled receptors family 1 profile domain-containing protein n=1 Tax=Adineta ricciae TaxID=249248 RepID=A0A814ALN8_ADIRI|nr:unnamed protein product [Adineta ricciae]CAF0946379.1 unnamed protein product [Adineta ricciae]
MNTSTSDSALFLPPIFQVTSMDYLFEKDLTLNTSNIPTSRDYSSFYRIVIRCLSFYALILVIIGTLGNFLTIIVLCRRNLRRFVTMRYLIAVSVCDIISLYGWNLNNFYKFTISSNGTNLEEKSLVHCRVMSYLTFVGLQLSSWCLTAVSLDRCLSLYFLTWKHKYGKLARTKYHIAFLAIICLLLNSHILFVNGFRTGPPENTIRCYRTRSNKFYIYPQWERVHLVVYNLCPFIIMLSCNTYIIHATIRSARIRTIRRAANGSSKGVFSGASRHRQLSIMLMLVTFAFVILTLPSCIYFVFFRHRMPANKNSRAFRHMVQICLGSVQFTSHAINFFLYCFSATNFRDELRDLLRDLCLHRSTDSKFRQSRTTTVRLTTFHKSRRVKQQLDSGSTSDNSHVERNHILKSPDTEKVFVKILPKVDDYRDIENTPN